MGGVDAAAAVAFFLCMVKKAMHTIWVQDGVFQVITLGLELLHTDKVSFLLNSPWQKAFFDCGTDTVEVRGNDA